MSLSPTLEKRGPVGGPGGWGRAGRRRPLPGLAGLLGLCLALALPAGLRAGEEPEEGEEQGEQAPVRPEKPFVMPRAEHPIKLPEGASRPGWELYTQNKVAEAQKSFETVLNGNPRDLEALEGLRACQIHAGDYQAVQLTNLRMLETVPESPLCLAFAMRTLEGQRYSESRRLLLDSFEKTAAVASPAVRALLKDMIATLHLEADAVGPAREALKYLGYVDRWLFAAGPFGTHDRSNRMLRRFAPERGWKALEFLDERGKPVVVRKDLAVPFRTLQLSRSFEGAQGVFYAFTNLFSEEDQEVLLIAGVPAESLLFLNGLLVARDQEEVQYPRLPQILRTRLVKGNNPLLVKLPGAADLTIRLLAPDYSPPRGVRVGEVKAEEGGAAVQPFRGFVFSRDSAGFLAAHFLRLVKERGLPEEAGLCGLAEGGVLNLCEARWMEPATQQENDQRAREALALTLAGSFPDSVGVLDTAASLLAQVGRSAGHSEARQVEDARHLRERALALDPDAHQHLLALSFFYQEHELKEQAFEKAKRCAQGHPQSGFAQELLGHHYQEKGMWVQAEAQFEKAAQLDNAFLSALIAFQEQQGSRPRARELRQRLQELGLEGLQARFQRLLQAGKLVEAAEVLKRYEAGYPDRQDQVLALRADLALEQGGVEEALALRQALFKVQPRNRQALLDVVDLQLRLKKTDEARQALRDYLREHPGNYELRRRLRELEAQSSAPWWEPYDIQVPQIDTRMFTQERYPRSTYAWIVDFMVTRINPDLSRESYVHIAQKVLNQQGINELSEVLLQAQRQDLVFIKTLNPDGTSYQPENVQNFNLAQSASLYQVGPGSILEHAYIEHEDAAEADPAFHMGFNFMALDAPRAVSRWIVLVPKGTKLKIRKIQGELVEEKILPGPEGYTVYQWTNKEVEGIKVEQFMPGEREEEVIPLVFVETPPGDFQPPAWLMQSPKVFLPAQARETARKLAAALPEERLKFAAIVAWVHQHIQPGKDAQSLEDVWSFRSGNTRQMTELAVAMAQAAGLSARKAYCNAGYAPGTAWRSKYAERFWEPAVLSAFGSGGELMVLESGSGPDLWLQYGGQPAQFFSVHHLFEGQAGALALALGDEGVLLKRVAGERVGEVSSHHRVKVSLDDAGGAQLEGRIKVFGMLSGQLRQVLSNPQQKDKVVEQMLRNLWPRVEAPKVQVGNAEQIDEPLTFRYGGRIGSLAEPAAGALFLQPFNSQAGLLRFSGPKERIHDLLIRNEWVELDLSLTYLAPLNHFWSQVPDDLFLSTEFGLYIADFNVEGRQLTCNRAFLLPAQRISPQKYPDFLRFLRRIAETEAQRVAYSAQVPASLRELARPVLSLGYVGYTLESGEGAPRGVGAGALPGAAPGVQKGSAE